MSVDEELNRELQLLAATDWQKFLATTGLDITTLKICKQRQRGKTLQQIANAMQMPKSTIRNKCKVC